MDEKTIAKKMTEGKVETVGLAGQKKKDSKSTDIPLNDDLHSKLRNQRKELSSTPTKPVTSFIDQIQFFNGNMIAFFNDQWNTIGGGSYKIGNGNYNSTSDLAITGVGFTPKIVIILATLAGVDKGGHSIGWSDASSDNCFVKYYYTAGSDWRTSVQTTYFIYVYSGTSIVRGSIKSFDSDGFTIEFGSTAFQFFYTYLAIG